MTIGEIKKNVPVHMYIVMPRYWKKTLKIKIVKVYENSYNIQTIDSQLLWDMDTLKK